MAIRSYRDARVRRFHQDGIAPRPWRAFSAAALRKLDMIDAAVLLSDLTTPPGNRLEALRGDRRGQHSIRINDQWRICFHWVDGGAENVEIVDYH
jgi:toxin HigB-1